VQLDGADLRGADLRGVDLSRLSLREVDLRGAKADAATRWPAELAQPWQRGVEVEGYELDLASGRVAPRSK
jgi:uncharacterized protein YjbI with pentapeptide repeats